MRPQNMSPETCSKDHAPKTMSPRTRPYRQRRPAAAQPDRAASSTGAFFGPHAIGGRPTRAAPRRGGPSRATGRVGMVLPAIASARPPAYPRRMFDVLREVEEALPELLLLRDWHGLRVVYEPPEVERVWRPWGEHRIALHCIHPCEPGAPLFHPHPWPSIVKVLEGSYEMGVGHGPGLVAPPLAMTILAGAGTTYTMTDRDSWHFVRPLDRPSLSLMVTGPPWSREMPRGDHPPQPALAPGRMEALLQRFAEQFYPRSR